MLLGSSKFSALESFSNPEVLAVIVKLQKAEIRLCPFSEPSNSEGAQALAIYAAEVVISKNEMG